MDYANTNKVELIVVPKVLFRGWLIYNYLQIFKLIKCKWLPGECADWFLGNIMNWSYFLHRRYSMSRQKNSILISEHALNSEPVPLSSWKSPSKNPVKFPSKKRTKKYNTEHVRIHSIFSIFWWAKTNLDDFFAKKGSIKFYGWSSIWTVSCNDVPNELPTRRLYGVNKTKLWTFLIICCMFPWIAAFLNAFPSRFYGLIALSLI